MLLNGFVLINSSDILSYLIPEFNLLRELDLYTSLNINNNNVLLIVLPPSHTREMKSEEVPCPMCTADHCADIATSSQLFPWVSIRPMTLRPTSYHFLLIYMNSSHHFRATTSYYRLFSKSLHTHPKMQWPVSPLRPLFSTFQAVCIIERASQYPGCQKEHHSASSENLQLSDGHRTVS